VSRGPRIVAVVLVVPIHTRFFLLHLPWAKSFPFVIPPLFVLEQEGVPRGVLLRPREFRSVLLNARFHIPRVLYVSETGMLIGGDTCAPNPEEKEPGRSPLKEVMGLPIFWTRKFPGGGVSVDGNTLPGKTRGFSSHGKIGATLERSGVGELSRPVGGPSNVQVMTLANQRLWYRS
jgi:hypothetical protein